MNRDWKRQMKKQQSAANRLSRPAPGKSKAKRATPLEFIKQIRDELGRVSWPGRKDTVTYSIVVLITVTFFTTIIYLMDRGFAEAVLWLIGRGGS